MQAVVNLLIELAKVLGLFTLAVVVVGLYLMTRYPPSAGTLRVDEKDDRPRAP